MKLHLLAGVGILAAVVITNLTWVIGENHLIKQQTEALRGCNDRYEEQAARAEQWRSNSYKCKDILQATVKRVSQCYEVCDGPVDRSPMCSGDFCFTPPARKVSP